MRVEQIVWNLLSNAVKFTPTGGRIEVTLAIEDEMVVLTVSDSGQGIEPSFLPSVFDMFRQGDSRSTRETGGLGIGLALVRQLVELHHGSAEVFSEGKGRGARFRISLPLRGHGSADVVAQAEGRTVALQGLRLLLIDDTPDTLEAFGALLRSEGAAVEVAASAREALVLLAEREVDVLLSDVSMPGMDGYQLLAEVRRTPRTAKLPAIALSGFGRQSDVRRALDAGFDAHIGKPVDLNQLIRTIGQLVAQRDGNAANGRHD